MKRRTGTFATLCALTLSVVLAGVLLAGFLLPWVGGPALAAQQSTSLLGEPPEELTDQPPAGNTTMLAANGDLIERPINLRLHRGAPGERDGRPARERREILNASLDREGSLAGGHGDRAASIQLDTGTGQRPAIQFDLPFRYLPGRRYCLKLDLAHA